MRKKAREREEERARKGGRKSEKGREERGRKGGRKSEKGRKREKSERKYRNETLLVVPAQSDLKF